MLNSQPNAHMKSPKGEWCYYYRHQNNKPPSIPTTATDVEDIVARSTRVIKDREIITSEEKKAIERLEADSKKKKQSAKQKEQQKDDDTGSEKTTRFQTRKEESSSSKAEAVSSSDGKKCGGGDGGSGGAPNNNNTPSPEEDDNTKNIYWQSSEARKLFGFFGDGDEDINVVVEGLHERINLLKKVQEDDDGYQLVIPMTEDSSLGLSSHNKFTIRNKSLFLLKAYQIALEKMRVGVRWIEDCCKQAVTFINSLGIKTTVSGKTVGDWHRHFRKNDKFPHPNPHVRMGKKPTPALFELFPQLEARVREFIMKHLDCFAVEMLRGELITVMIPKLMEEMNADGDSESLGYKLLVNYTDKPPSYSSVLRWVHIMGFTHSTKRKSYMVDGHEHKAQRLHRDQLTANYLTVLEPRCHRWVQMPVSLFEDLPERSEILHSGYTYTGIDGHAMIELHVDDHECLQDYANEKYGKFGGNVSVRITGKPIIIIGQDESVYNQFAFGSKQWVGKAGERAFLPKSNGAGVMISAFQSREFGFGMELTADEMKNINEKRKNDVEYFDKVAAKDVLETTKKKDLTESPFVRKLWYGSNNEGYWTGNHMIVQLEDCMDCLTVLFGETYDFVFLFDHSSGHAKKRVNGLDAEKMNSGHGGLKQHPTMIKEKEGYLGPYHDPENPLMVKVGEEQSLVWEESDLCSPEHGPFYVPQDKRLERRHDILIPVKLKKGKTGPNWLCGQGQGLPPSVMGERFH
mmetsp:Transcript_27620/g.59008  ORF Transcript_27620/g.59008 Transcript_27620/m.59008 type:complete len:743 (+) Transcript_27620:485-2713(+)